MYVYLDNAATSHPKPDTVHAATMQAMRECGNPGRSGHRLALSAGRVISEARMMCARLLSAPSPDCIIFTPNTTTAINMAIKGLLSAGDHVITSNMEHNSVSRPLHHIGVEVTKLADFSDIKKALKPQTKLVVATHISNVTGAVNDIHAIGAFCKGNGIPFLVDAAQSAGAHDISAEDADMIAFPGHKGLFGPQGTGGLYVRPGLILDTIIEGGTGVESESLSQPEASPDRYESGTLNTPGLAGLAAGVRFVLENREAIRAKEASLITQLIDGITAIDGIKLIGPPAGQSRGSVVSVIFDKISPAEAALMMDSAFGIAVRSGLHCAADAHEALGTKTSGGTLRISPNFFNTEDDINACLMALEVCAKGI